MNTELQPLHVSIDLPPAPLVLASSSFLSTLTTVEDQIGKMEVKDAQSAQAAADIQTRLTRAGIELEKQRKALKQPFIDAGRKIDDAATAPSWRIDEAKGKLRSLLLAYDDQQRKIAAEAEAKRQAELRRLEQLAREEETERQRQAEAMAAQLAAANRAQEVQVVDMDDEPVPETPPVKTETEKAIEAVRHAPAVVQQKPVGIAFRVTLTPVVIDIHKVPDVFVTRTANLAAIRSTFAAGWKEGEALPVCEGIRFDVLKTPVATGRSVF